MVLNPHTSYSRDTDSEGQWEPDSPWEARVRHLFPDIPDGAWILDIGCNSGGFGRRLLSLKPHCLVDGVDIARLLLSEARRKGYRYTYHEPAEALPIPSGIYDFVILSEILEHAENPEACVQEAARVLKPHGMLLGDVPTWYGKWGYRSLRGHKWHRRAFTKRELRRLLNDHFASVQIRPEPRWFTRRFLLSQWYTFQAWGKYGQ